MTNEHETNLLKVLVTELDDRSCLVHPIRRHNQGALVKRVEVAHDEHEVARLLHGEEPRARDVDDEAVLEDLDGPCDPRLQLEDVDAAPERLRVHVDLHVLESPLDDPPDAGHAHPDVVRVKHGLLLHRLLPLAVPRHLRHLDEPVVVLVPHEGRPLHVGPRLVGHFQHVLFVFPVHFVQDVEVGCAGHVVDV